MIQIGAVVMASEEYYVHDTYGDWECIYRHGDIGIYADVSSVCIGYSYAYYTESDWDELPNDEYVD